MTQDPYISVFQSFWRSRASLGAQDRGVSYIRVDVVKASSTHHAGQPHATCVDLKQSFTQCVISSKFWPFVPLCIAIETQSYSTSSFLDLFRFLPWNTTNCQLQFSKVVLALALSSAAAFTPNPIRSTALRRKLSPREATVGPSWGLSS